MNKRCIILGASTISDCRYIEKYISDNDFIVCADGGVSLAQRLNKSPNIIVGDFDSYNDALNFNCEIIKLPTEKDDTDLIYCVKECINRGYNDFMIFGALGGRFDHTYGNLCVLSFCTENNCNAVLYDDKNYIKILIKGINKFNNAVGKRVSFFPFGCNECIINYKGFKYGGQNVILDISYPMGISNEIIDSEAFIEVISGKVIVIFSED